MSQESDYPDGGKTGGVWAPVVDLYLCLLHALLYLVNPIVAWYSLTVRALEWSARGDRRRWLEGFEVERETETCRSGSRGSTSLSGSSSGPLLSFAHLQQASELEL